MWITQIKQERVGKLVSLYFLSLVPTLNKESSKMICTKEELGLGLQDPESCIR